MKKWLNNLQAEYFDIPAHRFNDDLLTNPTIAQKNEQNVLQQLLSLPPSAKIIDFGAGSGRLAIHFLQLGYDVLAVDISQKSLNDLQKYYLKNKRKNWGTLTLSKSLPQSGEFDAVVGSDVWHHIDIASFLPQFFNALKPQGKIVFSEPNSWHIFWYLYLFLKHIPWEIEKGILQCNYTNLKKLLKNSSFSEYQIFGHGFFPTPVCHAPVNYMLGRLFPLNLVAFRFMILASK